MRLLSVCAILTLTRLGHAEATCDLNIVDKPNATMAVSLTGPTAQHIFERLTVEAVKMDVEGYIFDKNANGILCIQHRLTSTYECVITVENSTGVLK